MTGSTRWSSLPVHSNSRRLMIRASGCSASTSRTRHVTPLPARSSVGRSRRRRRACGGSESSWRRATRGRAARRAARARASRRDNQVGSTLVWLRGGRSPPRGIGATCAEPRKTGSASVLSRTAARRYVGWCWCFCLLLHHGCGADLEGRGFGTCRYVFCLVTSHASALIFSLPLIAPCGALRRHDSRRCTTSVKVSSERPTRGWSKVPPSPFSRGTAPGCTGEQGRIWDSSEARSLPQELCRRVQPLLWRLPVHVAAAAAIAMRCQQSRAPGQDERGGRLDGPRMSVRFSLIRQTAGLGGQATRMQ